MMKQIILLLLIVLQIKAFSQNISGFVREKSSGESVPGAIIFSNSNHSISNNYGYYAITADGDSISATAYGFSTVKKSVTESIDGHIDFNLEPLHNDIEEVVVKSNSLFQTELSMPRMSRHSITSDDIKKNVALFGEADAIKTLQNLPGVLTVADGSVNVSVRGGSHDQNMIIIDEATVYNPSHALGLFSAFNPDAVSRVEFYKSGYSPKYGGKLSAVIDMHMKEGNNQNFALDASIGNVVSRLLIESPIVKNRGSIMIAGRYGDGGLINTIADFVDDDNQHINDIVNFYDFCAKTNWILSPRNRIFVSSYASHDKFKCSILSQDNVQEWGNNTATIRWNHVINDQVFVNYTATASHYEYSQQQQKDVRDFIWKASLAELTIKADFDHYHNDIHLSYGANVERHQYKPGSIDPAGEKSAMLPHHLKTKNMTLGALYFNSEYARIDRLSTSAGIRLSFANNQQTYYQIEPRLSISYSLSKNTSLKASYIRTVQFDHMLTNSAIGMPTDIWLPISKIVSPQTANTISAGMHGVVYDGALELFAEMYYKKLSNVVDYRDNANLYMNEDVDLEVKKGEGKAYGLETMAKYENRILKSQISYTYSVSKRRADEINKGNWYYASYDQRHNLSINTTLSASRNDFTIDFKYHTGGRATLPYTTYSFAGVTIAEYSERNGFIMPDFHRLDFSWCHYFRSVGKYKSKIIFSVYNCYGRKNAYSVFVKGDTFDLSSTKGYMLYLYRWVPSLTYVIKF